MGLAMCPTAWLSGQRAGILILRVVYASAPVDFGVETTSVNSPVLGEVELYSKWYQGLATPSSTKA